MARKRYTAEQIIGYLRQAEVMVGQGKNIVEVLREIGVTANTDGGFAVREDVSDRYIPAYKKIMQSDLENFK